MHMNSRSMHVVTARAIARKNSAAAIPSENAVSLTDRAIVARKDGAGPQDNTETIYSRSHESLSQSYPRNGVLALLCVTIAKPDIRYHRLRSLCLC
jgi:hypothetical protein